MATISNAELIRQLEFKVDEHFRLAVTTYQNLSESELLRPSETAGWSIAQCLWHLNSYGHFYLPKIDAALSANQPLNSANMFRTGWLGEYFTKMMRPGNGSKKMKAFKSHVPPVVLEPYTEVAEFIRQQETLLKLLRKAENYDMNKIKIPISISSMIRLKLGDVFAFIVEHDERHIQQANRNIRT